MNRLQTTLALLLVVLCISSCGSGTPTAPEARTTTIIGKAYYYDSLNAHLAGSGIKVQFEGRGLSAIADSNGIWTIPNVPAGYYDIRFSKPGYTESRQYQVPIVGGDTMFWSYGDMDLWAIRHHSISLDSFTVRKAFNGDTVYYIDFPVVRIDGKVQTLYDQQNYSFFVGRTSGPTVLDSNSYFWGQCVGPDLQEVRLFSSQDSIHSGDVIYVVAYVTRYFPQRYYTVGLNYVALWQDLGSPSNVVKVTLP